MLLRRTFLIITMLLVFSLFHLMMALYNVRLGYDIESLTAKMKKALAENRSMHSLVANAESLGRIEQIRDLKPDYIIEDLAELKEIIK